MRNRNDGVSPSRRTLTLCIVMWRPFNHHPVEGFPWISNFVDQSHFLSGPIKPPDCLMRATKWLAESANLLVFIIDGWWPCLLFDFVGQLIVWGNGIVQRWKNALRKRSNVHILLFVSLSSDHQTYLDAPHELHLVGQQLCERAWSR